MGCCRNGKGVLREAYFASGIWSGEWGLMCSDIFEDGVVLLILIGMSAGADGLSLESKHKPLYPSGFSVRRYQ